MKRRGIPYSNDILEHMQKTIEEVEKEKSVTAAKSLDLSPTANMYNAGITEEINNDDIITKLDEVEKDVKPLMDIRNFKVLNDVLKKSRHIADWIHKLIITNTNTKPTRLYKKLEEDKTQVLNLVRSTERNTQYKRIQPGRVLIR